MGSFSHAEKRNFAKQLVTILEQNGNLLQEKGFDPSAKIEELKNLIEDAEQAEAYQQKMQAQSKDATQKALESMDAAYNNASNTVEIMHGLLGKENTIVQELRMLRN